MRRTYRRKKYKPDKTKFKANDKIRAEEVRVIDQEGNMLGVMPTKEAKEIAEEKGLDLVEVNPTAQPPVVKFLDYGKIRFQREKEKIRQKKAQKKIDTKGIRLSFRISEHDKNVRLNQALKFLEKGHKVKVELIMRGRENAFKGQAIDMVKDFVAKVQEQVEGEVVIESHPKKEGGRITSLFAIAK